MTGKATKAAAKPKADKDKTYRVVGKELPIRVDLPAGGHLEYTKAGEEFKGSEWPSPHTTLKGAVKAGLIEEVG